MSGRLVRTSRLLSALLLVLGCGLLASTAHAAAPMVTVYGLTVNGDSVPCGEVVKTQDKVCVSYSSDQNATFTVSVQKDDGPVQVVQHGTTVAHAIRETCVAAGTADGIVRTFRVTVNNSYGSDTDTCTYVVGNGPSSSAPDVIVLGLRVNGASAACGTTTMSGDQVCLRFRSDQSGTATVSVKKGNTTTIVARGPINADVNYVSCVSAGTADNIPRTFTVSVSNSNGTDTESCGYNVAGVAPTAPSVTIAGLRVNGAPIQCGATVKDGDQVCVRFNSDQNGNAIVSVKKGSTTTIFASGSVTAGVNYVTCVTAGIPDDIVRTFGVRVSNANGADFETCEYTVSH